jgi:hypothetical protein
MGLPALLFPERQVTPPLIAPAEMQVLRTEMRSLFDDVRRACPADDSAEEKAVLTRLSLLSLSTYRLLQTSFLEILRQNLHYALAELVRKELATAEPARRLALRHIEKAVDQYGVLMEVVAAALTLVPQSSLALFMDELAERTAAGGELPMEATDRLVLRFQLDVLIALDVLDASLEELTFWAYRAITNTRRVEALPIDALSSQIRGELARVRSRNAWVGWDDEEIARELAPWPSTSR